MLPDCIAYDTIRTGKRQAGVFTGLWTAGETFGLALGPYIFGQTIQLFGYVPSTTGEAAPQSSTAELGVLLGFTVVPGIVVGAGAAVPARVQPRTAARTGHRATGAARRPRPARPGGAPLRRRSRRVRRLVQAVVQRGARSAGSLLGLGLAPGPRHAVCRAGAMLNQYEP